LINRIANGLIHSGGSQIARQNHLASADGCGTAEIMRRSGKAKPVVWRWQARFMAEVLQA
jgi:hypothetical protein